MKILQLNEAWEVRYEELECGPEMMAVVERSREGWMHVDMPCDVHMPLIENGIILEPLEKDYCFQSEWIEEKSWWFKKIFVLEEQDLQDYCKAELVLESLDAEADIFLNGIHLGHQKNVFYAFEFSALRYLHVGENTILVRVTSGLEHVSELNIAKIRKNICAEYIDDRGPRGDVRRAYVRKPQYVYGWDWAPRVASCGIMKDVFIRLVKKYAIRTVHGYTKSIGEAAKVCFEIEVENMHEFATKEAVIEISMEYKDTKVAEISQSLFLQSGINYVDIKLEVDKPALWWPHGIGEANLYKVKVSVKAADGEDHYKEFHMGIRTIRLVTDRVSTERRLFAYEINGVKIFAKGGNWVPADSIYARVSDEKYKRLISEAAEANINLLRVWGGGLYERDTFYETCDAYGIMVWQDFMFVCALYPDDEAWFTQEVEREMEYQTRRLRNHPSLVMWCGNNENHTAYTSWWTGERSPKFFGGNYCYHHLAPNAVHRNCKEIPYWSGSPYGGLMPHDSNEGDVHPWGYFFMNENMENRITPEVYDTLDASFVSEYGYVGPCCKTTTLQYMSGEALERGSRVWNHHNNTFEKSTVDAGIQKHYVDIDKTDLDGYFLYAGLCQGLMLQYSIEAFRIKLDCYGAMFWMYNDSWGEVGWTVIDYYLRRKISYYFVKRALMPVKLILREEDNKVRVTGINETAVPVLLDLEYGFVSYDGNYRKCIQERLTIPKFFRGQIMLFDKLVDTGCAGVHYVMPANDTGNVLTAVLREKTFREMQLPTSKISISECYGDGENTYFTVSSTTYAHAVYFNLGDDARLSDQYFDLLPGERKKVTIYGQNAELKESDIKAWSVYIGD